jgi:hypothetical protein
LPVESRTPVPLSNTQRTTMKYTLNKAAKVSGRAKSTISKAIKDGRISAEKNSNGGYAIDASELHRVFPFPVESQIPVPTPNTLEDQANTPNDTDLLSLKVTMLEAALETAHETVTDLRKRLDKADDRLTALTSQQVRPQETKGWLDRLLGR